MKGVGELQTERELNKGSWFGTLGFRVTLRRSMYDESSILLPLKHHCTFLF